MKEQHISYETAKLAKEMGFREEVDEYYSSDTKATSVSYNEYPAPTQSILQKWLREKYNIEVFVHPHPILSKTDKYYEVVVDTLYKTWSGYNSYETALEVGLKEALKSL